MQMLARRRVHIEFIDRPPHRVEQMRPGLQSFRRHTAATGFWFSRWPAIKQSDPHTRARQPLSGKRTSRAGANDQDIKLIHARK